jgi:hypothetical protein
VLFLDGSNQGSGFKLQLYALPVDGERTIYRLADRKAEATAPY